MAVELAHGGSLDRILAVLADATGAEVVLTSNAGAPLASALPAEFPSAAGPGRLLTASRTGHAPPISTFLCGAFFRATEPAHPEGGDVNLARIAGNRSVDILALALLQRMPPGLKEMAGAALMRAVNSGATKWRLQQLAPPADSPGCAAGRHMIRSPGSGGSERQWNSSSPGRPARRELRGQ